MKKKRDHGAGPQVLTIGYPSAAEAKAVRGQLFRLTIKLMVKLGRRVTARETLAHLMAKGI